MIIPGNQKIIPCRDLNNELLKLNGDLEDGTAKSTLAQFLGHNVGFLWELLTANKLFPYQEILLRSWLNKNFSMSIVSRGGAKTYTVSIFCTLFPILEPDTQIVIASSGFRRSRAILEQVDTFLKSDGSELLRQCYPHELKRKNDEFRLTYGEGGYIVAIPLNENARGFRGQVLVCDEGLLISEEMFRAVLMPFIVARSGIKEILQIKEIEDYLVSRGLLKEEDKEIIKSTKKIIMLSSASFKFQFLYNLYKEWIDRIINGIIKDEMAGSYFVGRLSYEALPKELIDPAVISEAQGGGMNESTFQREYQALFSDDSSGFYSAARMNDCTIKPGEFPCVELKSDGTSQYIITVDSNLSESQSSDHHAMSVFKLHPENRACTLVHSYAKAGKSFKEYALYFY